MAKIKVKEKVTLYLSGEEARALRSLLGKQPDPFSGPLGDLLAVLEDYLSE